jgi:hypothetical protein
VFKIDKGVRGPQTLAQLFASDQLATAFDKDGQDLERLSGKLEFDPQFSQLAGAQIDLKRTEASC